MIVRQSLIGKSIRPKFISKAPCLLGEKSLNLILKIFGSAGTLMHLTIHPFHNNTLFIHQVKTGPVPVSQGIPKGVVIIHHDWEIIAMFFRNPLNLATLLFKRKLRCMNTYYLK